GPDGGGSVPQLRRHPDRARVLGKLVAASRSARGPSRLRPAPGGRGTGPRYAALGHQRGRGLLADYPDSQPVAALVAAPRRAPGPALPDPGDRRLCRVVT